MNKLKGLVLIVICLASMRAHAQQADTNLIEFENSYFYHITGKENSKLILYMHGGVSNPFFKQHQNDIEVGELLEGNRVFVAQAIAAGYDVLLPVTNDSLNWLTRHEYCFQTFMKCLDASALKYREKYISGFSDGGTGSFKIFYSHPEAFDGLIVFNGYPYHRNFAKSVNYSQITDKKVLFFGTTKDKVMYYEFMLTEYCKQKTSNPNTYLYLREGDHSFKCYNEEDAAVVFDILNAEADNVKTDPIHGYIRKDTVLSFYKYRRSIYRKYRHGLEYYKLNKQQKAAYDKS